MASEISRVSGLLEVRHASIDGNVVAAFLFSDEEKALEAAGQVAAKKEEEFRAHCDEGTAKRPLSPIQPKDLDSSQVSLWTRKGECTPESILVFSAFAGPHAHLREIPTPEELTRRVAQVMPHEELSQEVNVIKDLRGIHLKN